MFERLTQVAIDVRLLTVFWAQAPISAGLVELRGRIYRVRYRKNTHLSLYNIMQDYHERMRWAENISMGVGFHVEIYDMVNREEV